MKYRSTKKYDHSEGISCAFRQWRATHSHCSKIHGYAIAFDLVFECDTLDDKNWAVDFGSLKPIKEWLKHMFDHKTVVALDDPNYSFYTKAQDLGIMDITWLPDVGCEKFAQYTFEYVEKWLSETYGNRCKIVEVTVHEHAGNSATYKVD